MEPSGLTRTFSVCLSLNPEVRKTVDDIRQMLPASPYRDDTPHMTLLRTIKSPSRINDADLLRDMKRILEVSKNLPLTAVIQKPANRFSPLFGLSSLVVLTASPEMKAYRKNVIDTLRANNYSVGLVERLSFLPHITVRLGVPFTRKARATAAQGFRAGNRLNFDTWIILRDIKKDGKYLVREVSS